MTKPLEEELNNPFRDDDEEDLSKLDRGDGIPEEKEEEVVDEKKEEEEVVDEKEEEDDKARERDESGRFKKKEKEPEKTEEEVDDEEEEDDKQNFPIRLNKAKKQRDEFKSALEQTQARLAQLEAQIAQQNKKPEVDPAKEISDALDTLYEQVEEARLNSDAKGAAKLQREIDAKNRQLAQIEAQKIASKVSTQTQLDAQYDAMIDVVEAAFPQLVKGTEEYDPEAVRDLEFQITAYEKMGMNSPAALRKAVKVLFREDPFVPAKKKVEKEEEVPEKKVEKKPEAKKTDVKKAAETQKKQPPDSSSQGLNRDDTKIRPSALSEEEFDKLPESKKRELRGDFVS